MIKVYVKLGFKPLIYHENLRERWKTGIDRQIYALTGARIIMKMTVNEALVGSEIPVSDHVQICIDVWTQGNIRKVQVIKNTYLLQEFGSYGDECHIVWRI